MFCALINPHLLISARCGYRPKCLQTHLLPTTISLAMTGHQPATIICWIIIQHSVYVHWQTSRCLPCPVIFLPLWAETVGNSSTLAWKLEPWCTIIGQPLTNVCCIATNQPTIHDELILARTIVINKIKKPILFDNGLFGKIMIRLVNNCQWIKKEFRASIMLKYQKSYWPSHCGGILTI